MSNLTDNQLLEQMIANALKPFIRELRMVDVADYVAFLHFNQHNQIGDIVDSAAEQYFAPGFLAYRDTGSMSLDWGESAQIMLALGFNTPSATFDFELRLAHDNASVSLMRVNEQETSPGSTNKTHLLSRSIELNSVVS